MAETLTVIRLGISGKLKHTLQSTNPIESMISTVRIIHRNVKHWSSGEMCLVDRRRDARSRSRFRKVQGYRGLADDRDKDRTGPPSSPPECQSHPSRGGRRGTQCVTMTPGTAVTKVPRPHGATSRRLRSRRSVAILQTFGHCRKGRAGGARIGAPRSAGLQRSGSAGTPIRGRPSLSRWNELTSAPSCAHHRCFAAHGQAPHDRPVPCIA